MSEKRLVIDGNAVYEVDEGCMRRKRQERSGKRAQKNPGGEQRKEQQEKGV